MITMKKENWKAVINFIITVLTAITSAFCVSSCQGRHPYPGTEGDDVSFSNNMTKTSIYLL